MNYQCRLEASCLCFSDAAHEERQGLIRAARERESKFQGDLRAFEVTPENASNVPWRFSAPALSYRIERDGDGGRAPQGSSFAGERVIGRRQRRRLPLTTHEEPVVAEDSVDQLFHAPLHSSRPPSPVAVLQTYPDGVDGVEVPVVQKRNFQAIGGSPAMNRKNVYPVSQEAITPLLTPPDHRRDSIYSEITGPASRAQDFGDWKKPHSHSVRNDVRQDPSDSDKEKSKAMADSGIGSSSKKLLKANFTAGDPSTTSQEAFHIQVSELSGPSVSYSDRSPSEVPLVSPDPNASNGVALDSRTSGALPKERKSTLNAVHFDGLPSPVQPMTFLSPEFYERKKRMIPAQKATRPSSAHSSYDQTKLEAAKNPVTTVDPSGPRRSSEPTLPSMIVRENDDGATSDLGLTDFSGSEGRSKQSSTSTSFSASFQPEEEQAASAEATNDFDSVWPNGQPDPLSQPVRPRVLSLRIQTDQTGEISPGSAISPTVSWQLPSLHNHRPDSQAGGNHLWDTVSRGRRSESQRMGVDKALLISGAIFAVGVSLITYLATKERKSKGENSILSLGCAAWELRSCILAIDIHRATALGHLVSPFVPSSLTATVDLPKQQVRLSYSRRASFLKSPFSALMRKHIKVQETLNLPREVCHAPALSFLERQKLHVGQRVGVREHRRQIKGTTYTVGLSLRFVPSVGWELPRGTIAVPPPSMTFVTQLIDVIDEANEGLETETTTTRMDEKADASLFRGSRTTDFTKKEDACTFHFLVQRAVTASVQVDIGTQMLLVSPPIGDPAAMSMGPLKEDIHLTKIPDDCYTGSAHSVSSMVWQVAQMGLEGPDSHSIEDSGGAPKGPLEYQLSPAEAVIVGVRLGKEAATEYSLPILPEAVVAE